MYRLFFFFSLLIFSSFPVLGSDSVTFTCPTPTDLGSANEIGKDRALSEMYAPMTLARVWGSNGSDANNGIVFIDDIGTFKIGYEYRAKECPRRLDLQEEISPGVWKGETIVSVCSPRVSSLFKGAKDFESEVWPKINVMADAVEAKIKELQDYESVCFDEYQNLRDNADRIEEKLEEFNDDVNGDGKVDSDDYEDTNGNSLVDDGDRGVINNQSFLMVLKEYELATQAHKKHFEGCLANFDMSRELNGNLTSLRGLELTEASRKHVTWIVEDGELTGEFSVPLIDFQYQRKMAWSHQKHPDGHFLFHDDEKLKPVFYSTRGCEMTAQHAVEYGGLESSYSWDLNYLVEYQARTWSFNPEGKSVRDEVPFANDLKSLNIVDFNRDDFVQVEDPNQN